MSIIQHHPRRFETNRYVYPVISRRSGGLSIGINLSPTGLCNFACVYCQILGEPEEQKTDSTVIDIPLLEAELQNVLEAAINGSLYENSYLSKTPLEKRILKDIAFSGDGEPTLSAQFPEIVERLATLRRQWTLPSVKTVLITNGTTLHIESVRRAVQKMLAENGEVWAKLDAGTPEFFQTVSRTKVSFEKILDNLQNASKEFPLVIQSCFLALHNMPPSEQEIEHYAQRLQTILYNGGNILRVQLYTVARNTAEQWATPLSNEQLDFVTEIVRQRTGLQTDAFYSR